MKGTKSTKYCTKCPMSVSEAPSPVCLALGIVSEAPSPVCLPVEIVSVTPSSLCLRVEMVSVTPSPECLPIERFSLTIGFCACLLIRYLRCELSGEGVKQYSSIGSLLCILVRIFGK